MSVHTKRPMTGIRDGILHIMDSPEPSLNVAHGLDRAIPGRRMTSRVHTLGDPHHVAWPTGQLQRPYKVGRPADHPHAARCPHAAIRNPQPFHGHSTAIPGHPGRLAASPSARALPPIPARLSPRRLASPHLTWPTGQFPSPARTQLAAGTGRLPACLALVVSAGRSAAPALQVLRRRVAGHPACKRSVVRK